MLLLSSVWQLPLPLIVLSGLLAFCFISIGLAAAKLLTGAQNAGGPRAEGGSGNAPQLLCAANAAEPGCVIPGARVPLPGFLGDDTTGSAQAGKPSIGATYLRVKVRADRPGSVPDCHARLVSIERAGVVVFDTETFTLPFVTRGVPGVRSTPTVGHDVPEYVDVLVITDANEIWLVTPGFADRLVDHLRAPGDYTIRMRITSPNGTSVAVAPTITWTGDRANSVKSWRQAPNPGDRAGSAPLPVHSEPFPDWPIRELFFYLDPSVLEDQHLDKWSKIGRSILDELSIGRLHCWGRPLPIEGDFPKDFLFKESSPVPILRKHWQGTDFTYRFFGEHGRYVQHTYPPHGATFPAYADLRVNKVEAQGIPWPKRHDPPTIPLMEACQLAYEQTRNTIMARAAERNAKPNGVVTWYCVLLWARMSIYGNRPPARKAQKISRGLKNTHNFEVEHGALVLKSNSDDERYENLHVLADDLPTAIADISAQSPEEEEEKPA